MDVSTEFKKVPNAIENHKNEKTDADVENKKRVFDRYLIAPIKNAVRYIVDGAYAFCRNIRSFLVAVCSPVCSCFRRAGSTSSRGIEDPAPYTPGLEKVSETEEKPEIPRLTSLCSTVLSGHQSQLSPGNGRKRGGLVVEAEVHASFGADDSLNDGEGETARALSITTQSDPSDKSSVAQAATGAGNQIEDSLPGDEPPHVGATSRTGSDQESGSASASITGQNDLPPEPGLSDEREGGVVAAPAPVVAVSTEEIVDPETESPLSEVSSGATGGAAITGASCDPANESPERSDDAPGANGKSLSSEAQPDVVSAASGCVAGLSMMPPSENVTARKTMKKQSVFTAPHFAGPAYNKIRQFLLANPDLRSNFPEEVIDGSGVQQQWRDLDFSLASLPVRDVGYCKKKGVGSPKKNADMAIFPLVGVDCFRNKSDASNVAIAQCPGSLACRWLQCKDAPGIFVINFRFRGMNMVLYYAVPEQDLIEKSFQPLLKKLFSEDDRDEVITKFKIIPELLHVGGVPDVMVQYASTPGMMNTIFPINGYHQSNHDTGGRADELHIDLKRGRDGLLIGGLFNYISRHLTNDFPALHIRMGFTIEPLAVDERKRQEKLLRRSIEDHLPERILGGVELFYPDIDVEKLPDLQLPPATPFP